MGAFLFIKKVIAAQCSMYCTRHLMYKMSLIDINWKSNTLLRFLIFVDYHTILLRHCNII